MSARLAGRRVLITGAARGIGALLAQRLHQRGAKVALLGLEPDRLEQVAAGCAGAPWFECDVADRNQVDAAVVSAVDRLGGLEVAIANAGIGAQMTLIGGDPSIWDSTLAVNLAGSYNLVRAAGPHVAHLMPGKVSGDGHAVGGIERLPPSAMLHQLPCCAAVRDASAGGCSVSRPR